MSRAPTLDSAGRNAARAAIRARLPHFAGCPDYLAETADAVVAAYLAGVVQADLLAMPGRQRRAEGRRAQRRERP